jgi:hypothetical protein
MVTICLGQPGPWGSWGTGFLLLEPKNPRHTRLCAPAHCGLLYLHPNLQHVHRLTNTNWLANPQSCPPNRTTEAICRRQSCQCRCKAQALRAAEDKLSCRNPGPGL